MALVPLSDTLQRPTCHADYSSPHAGDSQVSTSSAEAMYLAAAKHAAVVAMSRLGDAGHSTAGPVAVPTRTGELLEYALGTLVAVAHEASPTQAFRA